MTEPTLRAPARAVFERNRIAGRTPEGLEYRFHCPDAHKFPAQFGWDSCWHAIALRRIDPALARDELRSLLRAMRPDGFLPHTIFWSQPVRRSRRWIYSVESADDRTTNTIQPPFEGFVVGPGRPDVAGRPGLRHRGGRRARPPPRLAERERDLDGSNLVCLISPDESGLDASPKFDSLMGREAAGKVGFLLYQWRLRRAHFDLRESLARTGFCVQEVLTNVAHALSLRALANLSGELRHLARAHRVEQALLERCWDERDGLFYDRPCRRASSCGLDLVDLAPLALPTLPRPIAERLVTHLRDEREYALPWPIPSTALSEPAFQRRAGRPGAALLARLDLDADELAPASRPAGARLRGGTPGGSPSAASSSSTARACASTSTRSTRRQRAPRGSG